MRNLTMTVIGCLLALWMGAGRWVFGLGGELIWWYMPLIAVPYAWLQIWAVRRIAKTQRRGRPLGRAPYVTLVLSWLSALSFGFTVPDVVDGELVTVLGHYGGVVWGEMAIALCNPFGIIAFALVIASISFAAAAGRDPRPDEDAILDAAETAAASSAVATAAAHARQSSGVEVAAGQPGDVTPRE